LFELPKLHSIETDLDDDNECEYVKYLGGGGHVLFKALSKYSTRQTEG